MLTDSLPHYRRYFRVGQIAGLLDRAPYSNPYPLGLQHYAWIDGWRQGQKELKAQGAA